MDLTKNDPGDSPGSADAPPEEPQTKKAKEPRWSQPGSRRWFNYMRLSNIGLFFAPTFPLLNAVKQFFWPKIMVNMPEGNDYALTGEGALHEGAGAHVDKVLVEMDQFALWERLALAAPGLLFAVALAVVCRAMYRIEINLAGPGRKFTHRDQQVLGRGMGALWSTWVVVVVANLFVPSVIAENHWGADYATTLDSFESAGMMTFVLVLALSSMYSLYRAGKKAYDELSEVF